MKVAFVYQAYESLGLEYLSAVLKQHGHKTRLFFDTSLFDDFYCYNSVLKEIYDIRKLLIRKLVEYRPDIVCFSALTSSFQWSLGMARQIKRVMDVPIVFGGQHPTSAPEATLESNDVDYVVIGNGEFPLLELVQAIETGRDMHAIRNVWFKMNGRIISNPLRPMFGGFENLPWPDKELFFEATPSVDYGYTTLTSRGCKNSCAYCYNSVLKKIYGAQEYIFLRPIDDVMEELKWAKSKNRLNFIMFQDDDFLQKKEFALTFLDRYASEIAAPFWCLVHPITLDEESISALKRANCVEVEMGVQSIKEVVRKDIIGRSEEIGHITQAISLFKKYGIFISVDYILNLPKQSPEDLLDAAKFFQKNRTDRINLYWLTYYPRTRLTDAAASEGKLNGLDLHRIFHGLNPKSVMTGGSVFDKSYGPIHTLFWLMNILPAKWIDALIDKGWYRRLPFLGFSFNTFFMYITTYSHKKVTNKMEFYRARKRYVSNFLRIPYLKARNIITSLQG
jgi:anaerobic magnesium-protoporphyrin IX monomethyl ester cyclase